MSEIDLKDPLSRAEVQKKFLDVSRRMKADGKKPLTFEQFADEYSRRLGVDRGAFDKAMSETSSWADPLKTAALHAADTATLGFGDDLVGLVSPETGENMRRNLDMGGQLDPVSSIVGGVGGALVPGMGAIGAARAGAGALKGITTATGRYGKTFGGKTKAFVGGAAGGAAYGVGSQEPENRDWDLYGDSGSAALKGAGLGAVGGLLGKAVGRGVDAALEKVGSKFTSKAAKELAGKDYDDVLQGTIVNPVKLKRFAADAKKIVEPVDKIVGPETQSGISKSWQQSFDNIINRVNATGQGTNLSELNSLVSTFGKDIGGERNAAMFAKLVDQKHKLVDRFSALVDDISGNAGGGAAQLQAAKKMWTQALKLEAVENMIYQAELKSGKFSQGGISLAAKNEALRLLKLKNITWTPGERGLLEQLAKDNSRAATIKLLSRFAPKGGLSTMLGGGMTAYDPVTGLTLMAGGWAADKIGEGQVMKGVERLTREIMGGERYSAPFLSTTFGAVGADVNNDGALNIDVPIGDRVPR